MTEKKVDTKTKIYAKKLHVNHLGQLSHLLREVVQMMPGDKKDVKRD